MSHGDSQVAAPQAAQAEAQSQTTSGASETHAETAGARRFSGRGPIPPVVTAGAPPPRPSASERAYDGAPARIPNPTYIDAVHYAEEFFQRQADVAAVTGRAAETGFERFKVRTSEQYNRQGATASQLFALALSAAPGGAALLGVLEAIRSGEKIKKLAEVVEKIAGATEKAKALHEEREKANVVSEAREARSEGAERGNFQMEAAESLLEMSLASVKYRWSKEDEIDRLLEKVEYVDGSIDIKDIVVHALGLLPTYEVLECSAKRTADEFEYLLYYQYYAESGKAMNVVYIRDDERATSGQNDRNGGVIEGVPAAVLARITELGKLDDFRMGVAAFHTVQRHSVVQNPKPY